MVLRALFALLLAGAAPLAAAEASRDPWRTLEKLRGALAASGALAATFTQSYVPAGFTSGDSERGTLALTMPDCFRWDYVEPVPKAFLVCGATAWSWVEGEPRGQRATLATDRAIGLDLLLLSAGELSHRYRAQQATLPAGDTEILFEPLDSESELVAANLVVDAAGERPVGLEWRDREGNVSSFRFTHWHSFAATDEFSPPPSLEWSTDLGAEPVR